MEKFEIVDEKALEVFNNFVGKTKDALTTLIDNIKENIKRYEQAIEDNEKEIADTESSKEKCEHEITKMEGKISTIKEAIENVESTYKKMVDAYSQTSKGETKDIYSDIISGARDNCEKDVEKNRSEIARLNSDIEAIKNNIQEFDRMIESLNRTLENNRLELSKYNKALQSMEKTSDKLSRELDDIEVSIDKPKTVIRKKETIIEEKKEVEPKAAKKDDAQEIPIERVAVEEPKKEVKPLEKTFDKKEFDEDSLQRIYDLTGYKPKKEEPKAEEPVYQDNLENLFLNSVKDVQVEEPTRAFDASSSMSEWEKILNGTDDFATQSIKVKEDNVKLTIEDNITDTVDQLLKPYGTSFNRLKSLVNDKIEYPDGRTVKLDVTVEDVIKAVNDVDGNDLKKMKTVGPEITLLRKVKKMKEGK